MPPGGVERANQISQDRLVNISSIDAVEAFFLQFIASFDERSAVAAQDPEDALRPLSLEPSALEEVLARCEGRD